jgi:hypothetical protein
VKLDSLAQIDKIALDYKNWIEKGKTELWLAKIPRVQLSSYEYTVSSDSWNDTQTMEKIRFWINSAIQKMGKQKNQQFTS